MPRRAVAVLLACALAGGALAAAAGEKEEPPPAAKFSHAAHAGQKKGDEKVEIGDCEECHGDSADGELVKPGEVGHQPCLGCHAETFLAIGERTKKEDPDLWREAAAFCRGCHQKVPRNFDKAAADNVYRIPNPDPECQRAGSSPCRPEYYVELNHFEHTGRTGCRDCHKVHPDLREPGHSECAACHGDTAPPMADCAVCHNDGAPDDYFTGSREETRVRTCNTPEHLERARKVGVEPDEVPCFRHEREEHRFWAKNRNARGAWERGERLECSHCHEMLADKGMWKQLGNKYGTIKEIKAAPVMDPRGDENDRLANNAHNACGAATACHPEAKSGSGKACRKCHDRAFANLWGF